MRRLIPALIAAVLWGSSAARAAESPAEIAAVLESMSSVLDMAYEIERYAIQRGRLPKARSTVDLYQAVMGPSSAIEPILDAWGTPLHLESDPITNTYLVASAGSDRRFERQKWSARAATRGTADDIVVRDGEMIRWPEEWALTRFRALGGDRVESLRDAVETSKAARTIADMRVVATAIESYAIDHGSYPDISDVSSLAAALEPKFIQNMPRTDAWGNTFSVRISPAANMYRVVSPGADGQFDSARWDEKGETLDYNRDAVLVNGEFTSKWQTQHPARRLADAYAGLIVFKGKHASLRTSSAEARRKLRLQGLLKDADAAAANNDLARAISLYEEAEKLDSEFRDGERLKSWAFSLTLPPQANQHAAAARVAAALRRVLTRVPSAQQWELTSSLADLERARGEVKAAQQLIDEYAAAHPDDPQPRHRNLREAMVSGDTDRGLRTVDEILAMKPTDKEVFFGAGIFIFDLVNPGTTLPTAKKRDLIRRGRDALGRALKLDPEYVEAMRLLGLLIRQEASLETDSKKQAKLIEEADALLNRVREIMRRRPAGRS